MPNTPWYIVTSSSGHYARKMRKAAKHRSMSQRIIVFNETKTLLRIANKRQGSFQNFLKDFNYTDNRIYRKALPETFHSHCSQEINKVMKTNHEKACKECSLAISNALRFVKTAAGVRNNKEIADINEYNSYQPVRITSPAQTTSKRVNIGAQPLVSNSRTDEMTQHLRSPEVQSKAQNDIQPFLEQAQKQIDSYSKKAKSSTMTKEAWKAMRDKAETIYLKADEVVTMADAHIKELEQEEESEKQKDIELLAYLEEQNKPIIEYMKELRAKIGG